MSGGGFLVSRRRSAPQERSNPACSDVENEGSYGRETVSMNEPLPCVRITFTFRSRMPPQSVVWADPRPRATTVRQLRTAIRIWARLVAEAVNVPSNLDLKVNVL